ncbi:NUDIX hydrolase [Pontibaca methylaminivorans]|uniref:Uncharacterized conserved protein n=1 Tax=Pontibaca methylaminivorans TaxID=515897 RepID=A0A1R3X9Q4_9RHOB|nr:hypothetical protein [Pontibaca methylaminivorans]SIT87020.1 Uncharacterized conserved protein [Pontibaca methylaminivorans]
MSSGLAHAELIAVLVAVTDDEPRVMTVRAGQALPSGPFDPGHRSLQSGLRAWIESQTGHPVGYLEQLYTFADLDREPRTPPGARRISIGYLGLVREQPAPAAGQPEWHGWYDYFPWEDRRLRPPPIPDEIAARLAGWAGDDPLRRQRVDFVFGLNDMPWNEELALQRYELLYEAGLAESMTRPAHAAFGRRMGGDHRRILATGIARLRAKIKYHPVVFELLPESFTLLQLQRTVEALSGLRLHKSNFRRQIDQQELVEETGEMSAATGGRPAKLFRYRSAILEARALSGSRLPVLRH